MKKTSTIGININCPTSILIVQCQFGTLRVADIVIFPEIRDSGCHGAIRLAESVSKNRISDHILIKSDPKSNFYVNSEKNDKLT